ncbi:MAG: tRNA lysidine(34) synthetase TilS [Deltaproteobacteria bacterium]|nr:tRNA lysidine(34) synthetase TilS [Deltaproteobacteria bacterium]
MVSPKNRSNNKIEKKLLRTVRNTIARFGMFVPGDAVLIAVSGGPDSVTLAHVLHTLAGEYSLRLAIAHLNHCLRNQESDRDAEFVTTFARRLDLPFYLERKDVRSFQRQYHLSPEEAARQVRYAFYEAVASQDGFNKIALGHHCDDNAELVLMNLLRGSGPLGLSGIAPVRNDKIVRPLIHLKRSEILDYASEKKIAYVTDTSNTDPAFRRNKIRHHLIPELKKSYNPAIVDTLNRLGAILRAEDNWFEEALGPVFKNCVLNRTSDTISLSAPEFNNLTRAAKRRIIRKAIFSVKQDLRRITLFHVDAVLELAKKDPASGSLNLPGGIRVVKKSQALIFKKDYRRSQPVRVDYQYTITGEGITPIKEVPAVLKLVEIEIDDVPDFKAAGKNRAFFDRDCLQFPLVVRNFRAGDRFSPLGLKGTQKVKKYFINHKVPASQRRKCPLLLSRDKIIWITGHRIDNHVKIGPQTRRVLMAELLLA